MALVMLLIAFVNAFIFFLHIRHDISGEIARHINLAMALYCIYDAVKWMRAELRATSPTEKEKK